MKTSYYLLIVTALVCFLVLGCNTESDSTDSSNSNKVVLGKIEISSGWARPASQGQTSAVYLTISNGTASPDTLVGITSEIANSVEIHESIESDNGTTSMLPAGKQVIQDGHKLEFAPGGLHIMLKDLERDVKAGDSLSVSLEFSRVGTKKLKIPVQVNN